MPDTTSGHGIVVDLMKHDYPGNPSNTLYYAGRDRYGSLRFNTDIDRRTMLTRTATYLRKRPFGGATIGVAITLWMALHLLGLRAIAAVRHADA